MLRIGHNETGDQISPLCHRERFRFVNQRHRTTSPTDPYGIVSTMIPPAIDECGGRAYSFAQLNSTGGALAR
jgi:hypothetical protein